MSNCGQCGANLTPADMSQPACRHCGTVLAHYARAAEKAAEKVAVVNALMADANRNGIPDLFEGAAGLGATPAGLAQSAGRPMVVVHSAVVIGGPIPPTGGGSAGPGGHSSVYAPSLYGTPAAPSRRGGAGVAILVGVAAVFFIAILAGVVGFLVLAR